MTIPNSLSAFLGSDFVLWSGKRGEVWVRRDGITVYFCERYFHIKGDQAVLQIALNAIA